MLIVTGATSRTGQCLLKAWGEGGRKAIAVFKKGEYGNLAIKPVGLMLSSDLPLWLSGTYEAPWLDKDIEGIVHLGTGDAEYDKSLWSWCTEKGKAFVCVSQGDELEAWANSQEKKPPLCVMLKWSQDDAMAGGLVGSICRNLDIFSSLKEAVVKADREASQSVERLEKSMAVSPESMAKPMTM
jgi:hypothetical protein